MSVQETARVECTIGAWLDLAISSLMKVDIPTARLDCLVLLAHVLGKDKAWLLAHTDHQLTTQQVQILDGWLQRRAQHEPIAYITGKASFYGREFIVSADTLQPRAESESMIELLKQYVQPNTTILDVGTGSGCLAITAAAELPTLTVYACDVSPAALAVARQNIAALRVSVQTHLGNILRDIPPEYLRAMVILANLPYVPRDYPINRAARHEPASALFADNEGLALYEQLFAQAQELQTPPNCIITESLIEQHDKLTAIAKQSGYLLDATDGLAQAFIQGTALY
jgi:release factor glutamine methyltransferase